MRCDCATKPRRSWRSSAWCGLKLKLAAVAAVVGAFAAFIAKGVAFNKQVEKATIQFGAFFRNAEQAEAHVRSLTDFAARTPFQLPGILQASRMLLTFAADAAFGADTLRIVGDAAAGVSAPIEEVSTWFGRMYTAIQAGRPMGEALQRLQELGLLSGVARTKMEDLSKAGADQEVIMGILRDEWEKHDGAMERLSGTTEGLESTFTDLVAQVAGATAAMIGADTAYKKFLETIQSGPDRHARHDERRARSGSRDRAAQAGHRGRQPGLRRAVDAGESRALEAKLADLAESAILGAVQRRPGGRRGRAKPIIEEVVPAWEAAGHKSAEGLREGAGEGRQGGY